MEKIDGKMYYTQDEFEDFLFKFTEKAKADFKKETEELDNLKKVYA
jgi:hypothetical protein